MVVGTGEVARTLEITGHRHGCIILIADQRATAYTGTTHESGGRAMHVRRILTGSDQLQLTLMLNSFLIIPAVGFFMSAPSASPVMV